MSTEELRTLRDWVRWAASRFSEAGLIFGHGTDNALDEALALVLHSLYLDHSLPEGYLDAVVTGEERAAIEARILERIETRKPLPYITREAWFAGLPFYVDERVLVPRSPIAELIAHDFEPWLARKPERILDLCTGSGCIGIACAMAFPDAQVDLADVDAGALEVARMNVARFDLGERVRVVASDLFHALEGRYDLIVSNPPYVDAPDMAALPEEYRNEPRLGLAAGDDGLDFARRILSAAPGHLSDDGVLVLEVGNSAPALAEAFEALAFVWPEFEHGGHGVAIITGEDLAGSRPG